MQPSGDQVRVNAQLINAESGAHLWAEQFDTARADLLQTQDEIVTHLMRALELRLSEVEAARLKRVPAANPDAEDLASQCYAGTLLKDALFGKETEAPYRLCAQALDADPDNIIALNTLSAKLYVSAGYGLSADPKDDLKRADEMVSRVLSIDPNDARAHSNKAFILNFRGRPGEAIPEAERSLALDPALLDAIANLGWDYVNLGQYEKSLAYFNKAIQLSPRDPGLDAWYSGKSVSYFALKEYEQTIEWCRRAIAINPNGNPFPHSRLIAALALSGHEAEAHEALQRYLAMPPSGPRTVAAWKVLNDQYATDAKDPVYLEFADRWSKGLRIAGMPEE